MEPLQLFQLASKQANWLSVRESVVSSNIANANTPGYKAKDLVPFEQILSETGLGDGEGHVTMASTNPMHFGGPGDTSTDILEADDGVKVTASGNNVGLAEEMIKSSQIRQDYDLNANLVKSLNRMMLTVVRR